MISDSCVLEIHETLERAEQLSRGSATDRAQANVLVQKVANLRQTGLSSREIHTKYARAKVASLQGKDSSTSKPNDAEYRKSWDKMITGQIQEGTKEFRDFLAGQQTVAYTSGPTGGYAVPTAYDDVVRIAMSIVDPLLDNDVVDFTMTDGPWLQPSQISGWDLSTVSASILAESVQQLPQATPAVLGAVLRNNIIFRTTFSASQESEQDIPDFPNKVVQATSTALARRIGQSIVSGRGGTDITGFTNGLGVPSVSNATGGKITLTDILSIYFSINKFYRSQPKTGWLVTETTMKYIRAAVDSQGRPLLDVQQEKEILMGKPIVECPSLATAFTSIGAVGALVFGDLSHIVVRASRPTLQRVTQQTTSDITSGRSQWVGRMRCDAAYFSPSSTFPPVLAAIS